jgi:(2Fe-2S) ferredoxin
MGKHSNEFSLEGRFLGFILEDGYKIKWLRLTTAEGEQCIKLSKEARASVGQVLTSGDWIRVLGEQKSDRHSGAVKFKAYRVELTSPRTSEIETLPVVRQLSASRQQPTADKPVTAKATILVCQKSDCMQRGGKAVCAALAATLRDRGLQDQVQIRGIGCMKQCKAGPNLVIAADKTRYSRITPAEIPALVDRHFSGLEKPEVALNI